MSLRVLFSDVDGTLVHYTKHLEHWGNFVEAAVASSPHRDFAYKDGHVTRDVLPLPPSTTGVIGHISLATLRLVRGLREAGCRFVIVSGARTSTMLQRMAFLPDSDAIVTENGGRIFLRTTSGLTSAPFEEDYEWRSLHNQQAGPARQESAPPAERVGALWDAYRRLVKEGWSPDATSYTTLVRVKREQPGKATPDLDALLAGLPEGLTTAVNLAYVDIFPTTSGKENAVKYLCAKYGGSLSDAACLCDDDNDIEMTRTVGHAFIPNITADTLREEIKRNPSKYTVASREGFAGTEESLDSVYTHFALPFPR